MKSWIGIEVACRDDLLDELAAALAEALGVAVEITDGAVRTHLEKAVFSTSELERLLMEFQKTWGLESPLAYSLSHLDDQGWADRWKAYFKPLRVGEHFIVSPTWEKPVLRPGDRLIWLNPGLAFGTGHHETTRMCMEWLEKFPLTGVDPGTMALLDVGTGSGILAMAGVLLGFGRIVALDNDPEAIEVARENLSKNGFEPNVHLVQGTIQETDERFDVIVANIQTRPLISMAPFLVRRLKASGKVVLSGILVERRHEVRSAYEELGCSLIDGSVAGEWCLLVFDCHPILETVGAFM